MASTDLPSAQVTPRLLLRPWRPDDAWDVTAAFELYSHPEVCRWLGASPSPCTDLDDAHARLARFASRGDGVAGVFAIVPFGAADVPVGSALLVPLPRSDGQDSTAWEIGWHLHPDVWGRGYATEAGSAMAQRAAAAALPEVHAVVHPGNTPSLAVCDRLGMTRVGTTGEWYGVDLVDHTLGATLDLRRRATSAATVA